MELGLVLAVLLGLFTVGVAKKPRCSDGSLPVNCFASPCQFATCHLFPDAKCVDNYCGGCNVDWFVDHQQVDCHTPICELSIDPGPCEAYIPSWGFNSETGFCEEFIYGGCRGNANRFEYQGECNQKCDACELPVVPGPCRAYIPSWGFNSKTGFCEGFIYGGCLGNANRFESEQDCNQQCVCQLPLETGPCKARFPRYGFGDGECVKFIYGGCLGNANNFLTLPECEETCEPPAYSTCDLPIFPGPCKAYVPSWGFNSKTGLCEAFVYGGCLGNANRFETEQECNQLCVCQLPLETGPCEALISRYGFGVGECVEFTYGGCEGNANNFETLSECEETCEPSEPSVCDLPLEVGPCDGVYKRWGFQDEDCVVFEYGGCGGNGNNFITQAECADACGPN